jgi:hypothetical protein
VGGTRGAEEVGEEAGEEAPDGRRDGCGAAENGRLGCLVAGFSARTVGVLVALDVVPALVAVAGIAALGFGWV